jgi:LPS export ABC transporter protein LptC
MFSLRRRIRAARRIAIGLAVALLAFAWAVGPAPAAEKADPNKSGADAEADDDKSRLPETLDLTKLTYVDSQKGKSGVILEAADARVLPRREQVLMQDVGLRLAMANAKGELQVSCEHGELDLQSGSFVGIGKVRGKTPDGRQFETQRLRYDHPTALVTTDAPVLIRDGGGTLRGGGFRYYVREGRLKLLGGASVVQEE